MNLNGIQRLYRLIGWKWMHNKFHVLTNIKFGKYCLFRKYDFPTSASHWQFKGHFSIIFFCNSCKFALQAPSGSCFVSKFCTLSALSSTDLYEFIWNYHYILIYHIYCSYCCNTAYFVTFPEASIVMCSRNYLFITNGRKVPVEGQHLQKCYRLQYFFKGFLLF